MSSSSEVVMAPTIWREGPVVKICLPNVRGKMYQTKSLQDESVVIFLRADGEIEDKVESPLKAIVRALGRVEWHDIGPKAIEAISFQVSGVIRATSSSEAMSDRVCPGHLESHFVRGPLGETFSACRLGVAARQIEGVTRVAVAGLFIGDLLMVEGPGGYAAIARRGYPMMSAPTLWPARMRTVDGSWEA